VARNQRSTICAELFDISSAWVLGASYCVQVGEVRIDQGVVGQRPQVLSRLQLGGGGRQEEQMDVVGHAPTARWYASPPDRGRARPASWDPPRPPERRRVTPPRRRGSSCSCVDTGTLCRPKLLRRNSSQVRGRQTESRGGRELSGTTQRLPARWAVTGVGCWIGCRQMSERRLL
jgi:hypothetical protein